MMPLWHWAGSNKGNKNMNGDIVKLIQNYTFKGVVKKMGVIINHSKKYLFDNLLLKPDCVPQEYNIYTEYYMMDGFCIVVEPYVALFTNIV